MAKALSVREIKHGYRVARYSMNIINELGMHEALVDICMSANYHDIGKIYISNNILEKHQKLTKDEYEIIKMHTVFSSDILSDLNANKFILRNVLYHHENFDGSGYFGLVGENIPLGARIIRICDVFDALTNERPYKESMSIENALDIMRNEKNNYDPVLFELFIDEKLYYISK